MWYYIGYFENISLFSFVVAIFYKQFKKSQTREEGGVIFGDGYSRTCRYKVNAFIIDIEMYLSEPLISVNN